MHDYIVGPWIGGIVAALSYDWVARPPKPDAQSSPEDQDIEGGGHAGRTPPDQ